MGNTTKLGEMLLEAGLIDKFQLESGLSFQRNVGGRIGSALVKLGYIAEETILAFLDDQDNIVRVDLQRLQIPPDALTALPVAMLYENMVVPIEWQSQGKARTLVVAMTDPTNLMLIAELQAVAGGRIQAVVAPEFDIETALNRHFPAGKPRAAAPPPARNPLMDEISMLADHEAVTQNHAAEPPGRLDRLIALLLRKGVLTPQDVDTLK